jgi:hypothetical protein
VTHVAIEAFGVYSEPVYYALCEEGFPEVVAVNEWPVAEGEGFSQVGW